MPALLQALARLVALRRLGVLLFVLAATLCASSTASAFEAAQTKTRVWGFELASNNSSGLLSAATHGKHQGNRLALSEVVSDSLLAAEGASTGAESAINGARLAEQLGAEEAAGVRAPTEITGWSDHVLEQVASRDNGIGVSQSALDDAFASPDAIQYAPSRYGPTLGTNAGGSDGTGQSVSGVPENKTLDQLTQAESAQLCDWTNQKQGGYGRSVDCSSVQQTTDASQQTCVAGASILGARCGLTVLQVETCADAIGTALCDFLSAPGCDSLRECETKLSQ